MADRSIHVRRARNCAHVITLAGLSVVAMVAVSTGANAEGTTAAQHTAGSHIETDGMINKAEAKRFARAATPRKARPTEVAEDSSVWLFDYISRMLNDEPTAARRPRRVHKIATATSATPPQTAPQPAAKAPAAAAISATAPATAAVPPLPTGPAQRANSTVLVTPAPATNPIATGTLAPARPLPAPLPEAQDAIIVAAERSQARLDLIKLELASRTYDERKLSGQQVFDTRADWHVLERSKDALSSAELTSAIAAGFEANAYINETTRTIVVAVAGSQDLRRDFLTADVWKALIKAEAPQQFYMAKTYVRSVIQRYQLQGYSTECVGHSLGGGACAYVAAELGIRALVLNPISAGKLAAPARILVTNYIVDGEIANLVYSARGNEFSGNVQHINDGRDVVRLMALEKYGQMAGPILVIRELGASIKTHKVNNALELIAAQAETTRPK